MKTHKRDIERHYDDGQRGGGRTDGQTNGAGRDYRKSMRSSSLLPYTIFSLSHLVVTTVFVCSMSLSVSSL